MIYISHIVKKWRENLNNASQAQDQSVPAPVLNDGAKQLMQKMSLYYQTERAAAREKLSNLLPQLVQEKPEKSERQERPERQERQERQDRQDRQERHGRDRKSSHRTSEEHHRRHVPKVEEKVKEEEITPKPIVEEPIDMDVEETSPVEEMGKEDGSNFLQDAQDADDLSDESGEVSDESPFEEEEEPLDEEWSDFTAGIFDGSDPRVPKTEKVVRRPKKTTSAPEPKKPFHREREEKPSEPAENTAPEFEDANIESVESVLKSMRSTEKNMRPERPHHKKRRDSGRKDKKNNRHKWV